MAPAPLQAYPRIIWTPGEIVSMLSLGWMMMDFTPIVVISSMMVGNAILTESALSFLGLGDPDLLSWGTMIGSSRVAMWVAWWTTVLPGICIMVTVLALNFIGDGLNDALNPRRGR